MQKLFNADIINLIPTGSGFVYASKEKLPTGEEVVAFSQYNQITKTFQKINVNQYIETKFGNNGYKTARSLGDFITCNVVNISSTQSIASYADGKVVPFNIGGYPEKEQKVTYQNYPAVSPIVNGRDVWFAVPEANAVINYSVKHERIEFRIGNINEKSFSHPTSVFIENNKLYISNANSFKIRTVSLDNFSTEDYYIFNEPVYTYFKSGNIEYAVLQSGVYIL